MMVERIDRRILAGVQFTDGVTTLAIRRPLRLSGSGFSWVRNRSGAYVITGAEGLEAHASSFAAAPGVPPLGSITLALTASDPSGRYLPRGATLALPRDPDPSHADQPGSLFQPIRLALYPSAVAPLAAGWAVLRVTVLGATPAERQPGALVRVVDQAGGAVLGRGVADARGEALVAIPGIPVTTFNPGAGPVLATEIPARVEIIPSPAPAAPTDPDAVDQLPVSRTAPVQLASGREEHLSL